MATLVDRRLIHKVGSSSCSPKATSEDETAGCDGATLWKSERQKTNLTRCERRPSFFIVHKASVSLNLFLIIHFYDGL